MELRVDNSHDMMNLSGINLSENKKINVSTGSTDLDLFIFSGSKKRINNDVDNMLNDSESNIVIDNGRVR